ncbi:MAG: VOC family protein [Blastocatellia bacterium]
MDAHHTLNPFLAVPVKQADRLIQSYLDLLGGELTQRQTAKDGSLIHAEVKVGDATIGLTEKLPAGNYVWMITASVDDIKRRIENSNSGAWKITMGPQTSSGPYGSSIIMHASDLSGATWIFQQPLTSK